MTKLFRPIVLACTFILMLGNVGCGEKSSSNTTAKEVIPAAKLEKKDENKKTVLFFGDSLTAGYGLDEEQSYPSLLQDRIDSLGIDWQVVNAGLSGETTSGGLKRVDWVIKQNVDHFVLALGANDMLRGLPAAETRKNLQLIIDKVKGKYPEASLAIAEMLAAPNMGDDYAKEFNPIFSDLAKSNGIGFIPFFLNGVAGDEGLLLQDGKHPNAEGQLIVADNVWKSIEGIVR